MPSTDRLFIVAEFMDLFSLQDIVRPPNTRLDESPAGVIFAQVMAGLAHLHSGGGGALDRRMHRNIKPSNILLNSRGEAKITDLGQSAKLAHTLDNRQTLIASQLYMSPERVQGGRYTANCDVWSAGIVLILVLTGVHPYDQGSGLDQMDAVITLIDDPARVPRLVPGHDGDGVSEAAADFAAQCLVWDRELRPTSAQLAEHPWLTQWRGPQALTQLATHLRDTLGS